MGGCGGRRKPIQAVARPLGWKQTGYASWYGNPYHGRRAAGGEIYDMEKLTAAHPTLPFQTWVRVKNLSNEKTVDVRITDRGPFVHGRIIDLSRAAAREIDMIGPGTAKVQLTVIEPPPPREVAAALFAVQVGAFSDRANAERLRERLEGRYGPARIVERRSSAAVWRVLVGRLETEEAAEAVAARIRQEEKIEAIVVRGDPGET